MPFNAQPNAPQAILETFGSLVTETPASNLPQGVSPDNQDLVFVPGGVASRSSMKKVFASAFTSTPTVTYAKSYVSATGIIRNLYLDSNGQLWMENVTSSPGTATNISSLSATGIYARSITAFGREYIAPSDGLHGADIPLQYDGTNLDRVTQDGPGAAPTVVCSIIAASAMAGAGNTLARVSGVVTARTAAAHNLQVGYQAAISGMTAHTVGTVSTLVINNEDNPGIATVTTSGAHGLSPGVFVSISGVSNVAVGGAIPASNIKRTGQIVQCSTTTANGLAPGSVVTITGVTDPTFDTTAVVLQVLNTTTFTFSQANATDATSGSGNVNLNWPVADSTTPTLYQVLEVPTTTSFTVQINYSDGTWTTGSVSQAWDGSYYVASVPSSTSFTYSNPGPDATTTQVGTVTPVGQASPGTHLCEVLFLNRNGYITRGSPPTSFVAPGGQYISVTNIPIGPPNVVARILAFSGAQPGTLQGALAPLFYIATPAQVGTQVVSTATQINDNTTASIVLDFSDNTLFAATGISIPGNDVNSQIILDGALGFAFYGERLITWGQRNTVQNFLNLHFDGGHLSGATVPLGWTYGGAGGALTTAGRFGQAWQITGAATGQLTQSAYLDAYGDAILQPNQTYKARCWLSGAAASVTLTVSSVLASFTSTVTLTTASTTGAWVEGAFSTVMPASIATDMILTLVGTNCIVDEISIIYAKKPYTDTFLYGSYVNNPEAFDGVSGLFGPANDARKVMALGIVRSNLYLLTQEPSGRLHVTSNNSFTEPVGWGVEEIAGSAGVLSAFALAVSQADDGTAGGGEEWFAWASASGARIFGGDQPFKISQELQPDWAAINFTGAALTVWAMNDPTARVIYFGLPMGTATAPTLVYPIDYRGLNSAYEIAERSPVRVSFSGKLVATDIARKWTRWNVTANGASLMYRANGGILSPVLWAGNGQAPGLAAGTGNVYTLTGSGFVDDDYGQFYPYYTTHFFITGELETAFQLGGFRKIVEYLAANVTCSGTVTMTIYVNTLSNPWPLTVSRTPGTDPKFDMEWSAGNATGQRFAFKIAATP